MAIPKTKQTKQPVNQYGYNEADDAWYAQAVGSSGAVTTTTEVVTDTPEYFEDTSFVVGDSPVTLDINTALGRNAIVTTILNDGPGNFTVAYSTDGAAFGDAITLKQREELTLRDVSIDSVRITWASNSAYRVIAI